MSYRPHIKQAIQELVDGVKRGRTALGMRISITHGKGKFMICLIDKGGIKEGWSMKWYPYTKTSVAFLEDVIAGKKI